MTGVTWPSAVYQASLDRVDVFVVGDGGHLYDKIWMQEGWQDQGTPAPDVLFPQSQAEPAPHSAVYQSKIDRVVAFVVGVDGQLYDKFWNGTQWVWESQGTPVTVTVADPSAVYQASINRLVVFVVGSDGHLYDKFWNGTQWVWEDQGTPAPNVTVPFRPGGRGVGSSGPPAFSAVYQAKIDRLVVFVEGSDGRLYDKFWNGTQWVWEDQGTPAQNVTVANPSAVYQASIDRLVVFVQGSDGHLYDKFWNGTQWMWEDQGTPVPNLSVVAPSAVYQASIDRLVVFVIGSFAGQGTGVLYDKFWNGTQWVWEDQGTPTPTVNVGFPSAVYQAKSDRLVVFVVGSDGQLYDKFWNGTQWMWEAQGAPVLA